MNGFDFSIHLGISSSQLTFTPSFFRGVGGEKPPTRMSWDQTSKTSLTGETMTGDV